MAIGIGIKVDLQQAKRDIDIFNRDINQACQDREMSVGVDSADVVNTSALLTKLREEISRMGELSRASTNRGGLLRKEQFMEAAELVKKVQGGFSKWTDEINTARNALKNLIDERKDLQYTMGQVMAGKERLTPAQINATTDRLEAVEAEEKATRDRIAKFRKEQERVDGLQDRARRYGGILGGSGIDPDKTSQQLGISLKKALGYGLAAAGGFSLLGFLGSSRAKYQQSVGHQVNLGGRGVTGDDNAGVGVGMGPLEFMALKEQMSQTGLKGSQVQGKAQLAAAFARANGVDAGQVAGLYSSAYQATGRAELGSNVLSMIDAVRKGMDKARISELMSLVSSNTAATAQAMGGAGATSGQVLQSVLLSRMGMELNDNVSYKQYMKSGEFQNVMQNGLQGAGTTAGEIMLFNAVGGYNGPMDFEKIHEMNLIRQGGFKQRPELLSNILGQLHGSDKAKAGQLETMFPDWKTKGIASDKLILFAKSQTFRDYSAQAKRLDDAEPATADEKALQAKYEKEYGALQGADKQTLEAEREKQHLATGEKLNAALGAWEKLALKMVGSLLDANATQKLTEAIGRLGSMADSPAVKAAGFAGEHPGAVIGGMGALKLGWVAMKKRFAGAAGSTALSAAARRVAPSFLRRMATSAVVGATGIGAPLATAMTIGGVVWTAYDVYQALLESGDTKSAEQFKKDVESQSTKQRAHLSHTQFNDPSKVFATKGKTTSYKKPDGNIHVKTGDRNFRNNNPGNIEYGDFAIKHGAIGSDGRFAIFPDMATGQAAAKALLQSKDYRGLTATQVVDKWAPEWVTGNDGIRRHENPNNPAYKQKVLQALKGQNTRPQDWSPDQMDAVLKAKQSFEGGRGTEYTAQADRNTAQDTPTVQQASEGQSDFFLYKILAVLEKIEGKIGSVPKSYAAQTLPVKG